MRIKISEATKEKGMQSQKRRIEEEVWETATIEERVIDNIEEWHVWEHKNTDQIIYDIYTTRLDKYWKTFFSTEENYEKFLNFSAYRKNRKALENIYKEKDKLKKAKSKMEDEWSNLITEERKIKREQIKHEHENYANNCGEDNWIKNMV
jgi:predicted RNase H-like nuclease (RuvC/YqgF family)